MRICFFFCLFSFRFFFVNLFSRLRPTPLALARTHTHAHACTHTRASHRIASQEDEAQTALVAEADRLADELSLTEKKLGKRTKVRMAALRCVRYGRGRKRDGEERRTDRHRHTHKETDKDRCSSQKIGDRRTHRLLTVASEECE